MNPLSPLIRPFARWYRQQLMREVVPCIYALLTGPEGPDKDAVRRYYASLRQRIDWWKQWT